jgi:uncharacterized protein (TIGR03790 family)
MWWWAAAAVAGGAPRDVMVVYRADDAEAEAVAEQYAVARPGAALCPVPSGPAGAVDVDFATFVATIRDPLDACLATRDGVDYLVTVRGLPARVTLPAFVASLEAVLQLGHAVDGAEEVAGRGQSTSGSVYAASVSNPYYLNAVAQPGDFTLSNPSQRWYQSATALVRTERWPKAFAVETTAEENGIDFTGALRMVSRLDGFDYADAHDLIDRALEAEQRGPTGSFLCMHGADDARGARDPECEFAIRMLQGAGVDAAWVPAFDPSLAGQQLMGWFSGAEDARGAIDGNVYAPGALVDNVTSYGAVPGNFVCSADGTQCPASETQTSIARWVAAGATGVHGTVEEPLNNVFPNASVMLWYAMGYSAGESWLYSEQFLYWQNLHLGDPLVAPFAVRPAVEVVAEAGGVLRVRAEHPDGVDAVRLWVDDALVAESEGDELVWTATDPPGAEVAVYAEATAASVERSVPDWPIPVVTPRPGVVGWTTGARSLLPPDPATPGGDDPADAAAAPPASGCGCDAGGGSPVALGLVASALAARRRRR